MWSLRFARDDGQSLNLGQGSPKRFLYNTGNTALKKFDTHLTYLFHRHDRHTGIGPFNLQHLFEIFIRSSKTERMTELECSFPVEIARSHEFDFIRLCNSESRERRSMARPRVFTAASEGNSDHSTFTSLSFSVSRRASIFLMSPAPLMAT